ncbi:MAG: extracellular solute-binding protein [Treponema sp.]|jgi:ABC-type glycerol-3-phosphate transport system substrate-binding protein|nr:extracellular solute-binding protein [Treponema sp.]
MTKLWKQLPLLILPCVAVAFVVLWVLSESNTAVLWTDQPEFALYVESFNAAQDNYKIEFHYMEVAAQRLSILSGTAQETPDIVIGNWLKSATTRTLFKPLDSFFTKNKIAKAAFYPRLLNLGTIEEQQYLLPVSFNIPALVFTRANAQLLSNPFTIGFDEIKTLGKTYNVERNGIYSRMGFSPAWNDEFLYVTATLFNAAFREAEIAREVETAPSVVPAPSETAGDVTWNPEALEEAITALRDWTQEVNTSIQAEDDFVFKYFYEPSAKLAMSGRILFTYMDSAGLFTLSQEQRSNLDFRWIAENNTIPVSEDTVYYGIYKRGKAKKAADAFTEWFFQAETQRQLLEISKKQRINETYFGISNGFSAIRTVTEQIFPLFYPSLLGHMPPSAFLSPPNILPQNWSTLKAQVIIPYLHTRIRQQDTRPLERHISDWYRTNSGF